MEVIGDLTFVKFVEWSFLSVISGSAIFMTRFLSKMNDNIGRLNQKLAVVIDRQSRQGSELEKHEDRIQRLERII